MKESREQGVVVGSKQVPLFHGVLCESMYDRDSLRQPIWTCTDSHYDPYTARACAEAHAKRTGLKVYR